jgi:hypothetical protein
MGSCKGLTRLIIFTLLLFFCINIPVFADEIYNTRAEKESINRALNLLADFNNINAKKAFRDDANIVIAFYNLEEINPNYKNFYAVTATSDTDNKTYILLAKRLNKSPYQAISALIAHELVHAYSSSQFDSLNEEHNAFTMEVETWSKIIKNNPELENSDDELIKRENKLLRIHKEGNLLESIRNNRNYKEITNKR